MKYPIEIRSCNKQQIEYHHSLFDKALFFFIKFDCLFFNMQSNNQSIEHQHHIPRYRCSHSNKNHEMPPLNSLFDNSHILLSDQHTRDLTDVYRREKNFLEQTHNYESQKQILIEKTEGDECELKCSTKVNNYTIPCVCETSRIGRIFQSKT